MEQTAMPIHHSLVETEESMMRVGFIGLGNVGGKLAGSLLRNGKALHVFDLNADFVSAFVEKGAVAGTSAAQLMRDCDVVVTCLPSPAACDAVVTEMLPLSLIHI